MTDKKFFRCTVCNDVHYGVNKPEECPTCSAKNAYVLIEDKEARMIEFREKTNKPSKSVEELKKDWKEWTQNKEFVLNPDIEHAETAIKGALENEEKTGLKYCPCRLVSGDFEKDLELICPCNFKIQNTWDDKGMCWCGLFVK